MRLQITVLHIDNWHFKICCQYDTEGHAYLEQNLTWKYQEYGPVERLPNGKWKMGYQEKLGKLFYRMRTNPMDGEYYFLAGFKPYILYHFGQWITNPDYLSNLNPEYEELHFDGLYEWQNADLNQLTRYKRGLFSTRPGYGKSQTIATYLQHLLDKGKHVLVATPSSKSLEELILRYNKLNNKNWKKFDENSPLNFVNVNGFCRQKIYKDIPESFFSGIDVLILDEAEYNCTKSAQDLFFRLSNVKQVYAFSATADAEKAEVVSIKQGITGSVQRNVPIAGLLGFTLVYSKAEGYDITVHEVTTECFTDVWFKNLMEKQEKERQAEEAALKGEDVEEDTSTFQDLMSDLYCNYKFCKLMEGIARSSGCLFVPINTLNTIDYWNDNVLLEDGEQTCIISSRGIELYTANSGEKTVRKIKLEELKEIVKSKDSGLKLILGTKSAYNAVDLPGLSAVMPVSNKMASSVIQYVGRAARGSKFDVYIPIPFEKRSCPVLWKDGRLREKLILDYYSQCKITTKFETEAQYE